jgi:hypothetical protein
VSRGAAEGVVVRPSPGRLRRKIAVAAPGVAMSVFGLATGDTESIGPWALSVSVALLVLCVAALGVFYTLQFRNECLFGQDPDLVHIDWRGRVRVVPRAQISGVELVTVASAGGPRDERMIITMSSGAPPFVIRVGMWDTGRLHDLLQDLGLGVRVAHQPMKPRELLAHFPGMRMRYPERHPWLFGLAATAVVVVVIAVIAGIVGGS